MNQLVENIKRIQVLMEVDSEDEGVYEEIDI